MHALENIFHRPITSQQVENANIKVRNFYITKINFYPRDCSIALGYTWDKQTPVGKYLSKPTVNTLGQRS